MADNDDIPFNRDFPLKPGAVDEVRPGVRRILQQPEPVHLHRHGAATSWARASVAIVDPGPDDDGACQRACWATPVARRDASRRILVSHTHTRPLA